MVVSNSSYNKSISSLYFAHTTQYVYFLEYSQHLHSAFFILFIQFSHCIRICVIDSTLSHLQSP